MIELTSFLFGLGFSILVYFRSIRTADLPPLRKAFTFLITFIGITGMLFLSGVLIAHTLRKRGVL
jgi:heme/copper-type cytochrome/quinol oxidase subunit 3